MSLAALKDDTGFVAMGSRVVRTEATGEIWRKLNAFAVDNLTELGGEMKWFVLHKGARHLEWRPLGTGESSSLR